MGHMLGWRLIAAVAAMLTCMHASAQIASSPLPRLPSGIWAEMATVSMDAVIWGFVEVDTCASLFRASTVGKGSAVLELPARVQPRLMVLGPDESTAYILSQGDTTRSIWLTVVDTLAMVLKEDIPVDNPSLVAAIVCWTLPRNSMTAVAGAADGSLATLSLQAPSQLSIHSKVPFRGRAVCILSPSIDNLALVVTAREVQALGTTQLWLNITAVTLGFDGFAPAWMVPMPVVSGLSATFERAALSSTNTICVMLQLPVVGSAASCFALNATAGFLFEARATFGLGATVVGGGAGSLAQVSSTGDGLYFPTYNTTSGAASLWASRTDLLQTGRLVAPWPYGPVLSVLTAPSWSNASSPLVVTLLGQANASNASVTVLNFHATNPFAPIAVKPPLALPPFWFGTITDGCISSSSSSMAYLVTSAGFVLAFDMASRQVMSSRRVLTASGDPALGLVSPTVDASRVLVLNREGSSFAATYLRVPDLSVLNSSVPLDGFEAAGRPMLRALSGGLSSVFFAVASPNDGPAGSVFSVSLFHTLTAPNSGISNTVLAFGSTFPAEPQLQSSVYTASNASIILVSAYVPSGGLTLLAGAVPKDWPYAASPAYEMAALDSTWTLPQQCVRSIAVHSFPPGPAACFYLVVSTDCRTPDFFVVALPVSAGQLPAFGRLAAVVRLFHPLAVPTGLEPFDPPLVLKSGVIAFPVDGSAYLYVLHTPDLNTAEQWWAVAPSPARDAGNQTTVPLMYRAGNSTVVLVDGSPTTVREFSYLSLMQAPPSPSPTATASASIVPASPSATATPSAVPTASSAPVSLGAPLVWLQFAGNNLVRDRGSPGLSFSNFLALFATNRRGVAWQSARFDRTLPSFMATKTTQALLPAGSDARTLVAWVRISRVLSPVEAHTVAYYGSGGMNQRCGLQISVNGRPSFTSLGLDVEAVAAPDLRDGQWHMVGVTYNPNSTNPPFGFYLNGTLLTPSAYATTVLPGAGSFLGLLNTTEPSFLLIGRRGDAVNNSFAYFDGDMDEVRVFRWALPPAEMAALFLYDMPAAPPYVLPSPTASVTPSASVSPSVSASASVTGSASASGSASTSASVSRSWSPSPSRSTSVSPTTSQALSRSATASAAPSLPWVPPPLLWLQFPFGAPTDLGILRLPFQANHTSFVQNRDGPGVGRKAAAFNPASQSSIASVTADAALPAGDAPRTLSAWVRHNPMTEDDCVIASYGGPGSNEWVRFALRSSTGHVTAGSDVRVVDANDSPDLRDGWWHHVVVTYSAVPDPGQSVHVYINGSMLPAQGYNSTLFAPVLATTTNTSFVVGRNPLAVTPGENWQGELDDIRLYNVSLSDAQVAALFLLDTAFAPRPSAVASTAASSTVSVSPSVSSTGSGVVPAPSQLPSLSASPSASALLVVTASVTPAQTSSSAPRRPPWLNCSDAAALSRRFVSEIEVAVRVPVALPVGAADAAALTDAALNRTALSVWACEFVRFSRYVAGYASRARGGQGSHLAAAPAPGFEGSAAASLVRVTAGGAQSFAVNASAMVGCTLQTEAAARAALPNAHSRATWQAAALQSLASALTANASASVRGRGRPGVQPAPLPPASKQLPEPAATESGSSGAAAALLSAPALADLQSRAVAPGSVAGTLLDASSDGALNYTYVSVAAFIDTGVSAAALCTAALASDTGHTSSSSPSPRANVPESAARLRRLAATAQVADWAMLLAFFDDTIQLCIDSLVFDVATVNSGTAAPADASDTGSPLIACLGTSLHLVSPAVAVDVMGLQALPASGIDENATFLFTSATASPLVNVSSNDNLPPRNLGTSSTPWLIPAAAAAVAAGGLVVFTAAFVLTRYCCMLRAAMHRQREQAGTRLLRVAAAERALLLASASGSGLETSPAGIMDMLSATQLLVASSSPTAGHKSESSARSGTRRGQRVTLAPVGLAASAAAHCAVVADAVADAFAAAATDGVAGLPTESGATSARQSGASTKFSSTTSPRESSLSVGSASQMRHDRTQMQRTRAAAMAALGRALARDVLQAVAQAALQAAQEAAAAPASVADASETRASTGPALASPSNASCDFDASNAPVSAGAAVSESRARLVLPSVPGISPADAFHRVVQCGMQQAEAVLQRHFSSDGMETLAAAAGAECAAYTDLWLDASLQADANLPIAAAVPLEDQIALIKRRLRPAQRSTKSAAAGDGRHGFAPTDAALSEKGRVQHLRQAIETRLARSAAAQQAALERHSVFAPTRGERRSSRDADTPTLADEYGAVAVEECGEDGVAEVAIQTAAEAQRRSSRPSNASLADPASSSAALVRKGTHSQLHGSSVSRLEVNMAASRHAAQRREAVSSMRHVAAAEVIAPSDELLFARCTLQALVLCTLGVQAQQTSAALVSSLRPEDAGTAKLLDQVASQQATKHEQITRSQSAGVGSRGSSRRLSIARALSARVTKAGVAVGTLRARSHSKFSFVVADEDPDATAAASQHSNPLLHSSRSSTPRTPGGGLDAMQQRALAAQLLEDSLAVVDAAAQTAARAARGAAWKRAVGWLSCCRQLGAERWRGESLSSKPHSCSAGDSLVLRAMQAQRSSETSNAALRHLRGTAGFRNSDRSKMSGLVRASVAPSAMPSNAAAVGRTSRTSVVARRQSIASAGGSMLKHTAPPAGHGRVGRASRRPSALLLSAFPPAPVAATSPAAEAYNANPLLLGNSEEGAHSEVDALSQPATSPRSASSDVRRLRLSARHRPSGTSGSSDAAGEGKGSSDRRAMRGSFVKPITGTAGAIAVRSARR